MAKTEAFRIKPTKRQTRVFSESFRKSKVRERIQELEQLVGQKQIQIEFKEKMIELAEEMYQVDIKKKLGLKLSNGSGSTGKNTGGK